MLTESEVKKTINKILNGGPGSGNHAPGQGRGVGKPGAGAGGSSKARVSGNGTGNVSKEETDKREKLLLRATGKQHTTGSREMAERWDPVEISEYMYETERIYEESNPKRWATSGDLNLSEALEIDRSKSTDEWPYFRSDYWKENLELAKEQKRGVEISKAKAEREEHIKQIDKIIGSEKISEGRTKAEDDKNYKKLEKDVREIKKILTKEKSRENFGQDEIRKLKDKYSDYMSGNWSTVERFKTLIRDFEDWADNYQNY
ncbi:MAG: hypothetical protein IJ122_05960 [Methanobrevibacter sp.]|nr:hypothetical protein [Methanobrevibacter sp.]